MRWPRANNPPRTNAKADAAVATPHASATSIALTDAQLIERGDYMVRIAGCNDCHTPGYPESGGKVPKAQWLVGTRLGWNGPWGTTYPANLRLKAADMDDAAWLAYTGTCTRARRCPTSPCAT